jgi:hypothetical protein
MLLKHKIIKIIKIIKNIKSIKSLKHKNGHTRPIQVYTKA